jgi:MutL protein
VLSGGVFRHAEPAAVEQVVARLAADAGGAGSVVGGTPVVVDRCYVLAAVGLLAAEHPEAATALASGLLVTRPAP